MYSLFCYGSYIRTTVVTFQIKLVIPRKTEGDLLTSLAMLLLAADTSGKHGSIALARLPQQSTSHKNSEQIEVIETVPLAGGTFSAGETVEVPLPFRGSPMKR